MRALVTGCAGFIGSHLTESLLADDIEVLGVDCFNDNYGRPVKLANLERAREWKTFDFVPVDLSRGALSELVREVDTVFHLAAEPGTRLSWGTRFETYVRNNLVATQHVLEAMRASPEATLVYASSSSVYGHAESYPTAEDVLPRPFSPYGVTKLAAEHLCQLYGENHGVRTISLRYFSVYGPRQRPDMAFSRFLAAASTGQPIQVMGDGAQTRDFTYVADVVAATRAAATSPKAVGNVYNIGGGSQTTVREAIEILEGLLDGDLTLDHRSPEPGDVKRTGADIGRARADLGFEPRTSLSEGLLRQFTWARESDAPLPRLGR
jgi:nucleoside-diphosphate-sugar epimerase